MAQAAGPSAPISPLHSLPNSPMSHEARHTVRHGDDEDGFPSFAELQAFAAAAASGKSEPASRRQSAGGERRPTLSANISPVRNMYV